MLGTSGGYGNKFWEGKEKKCSMMSGDCLILRLIVSPVLGVVAHSCNLTTERLRQENGQFEANLGFIESVHKQKSFLGEDPTQGSCL
jgi:hypothetical protein